MYDNATVTCPWCWSPIELGLDSCPGTQDYVEDCSVCCHPMQVRVEADADGVVLGVEVEREGG